MTRVTLGHTGQDMTAGAGMVAICLALVLSVLLRVTGAILPESSGTLYIIAGLFWIAAFGGFAVTYSPLLLREPAARRG